MKIDKRAYAEMFGPTVGDRVRLAPPAAVGRSGLVADGATHGDHRAPPFA